MNNTTKTTNGMNAIVRQLKEVDEDFEFYPTTQEIVDKVAPYLRGDILDIGCGDGAFFKKLRIANEKLRQDTMEKCGYEITRGFQAFGIEKSHALAARLDEKITLLGTDFWEQTLIDKEMDCIWCNPPYSEYEAWAEKIIKTGNAETIAMVIPQRWRNSEKIKRAIESRDMEAETLGQYDFKEGERKARGIVELILIQGKKKETLFSGEEIRVVKNPFDVWFDETFSIAAEKPHDYKKQQNEREAIVRKINNAVVVGDNIVDTLLNLYIEEQNNLIKTYRSLENVEGAVFKELDIDIEKVKKVLRMKVKGLKHIYWHKLFEQYNCITKRLTTASVQHITDRLNGAALIDFTRGNIYQITLWVIQNSNKLFDEQIKAFYLDLVRPENIHRYKSNHHWTDDEWRYMKDEYSKCTWRDARSEWKNKMQNVLLDYRIICEGCNNFDYSGISDSAWCFLHDIICIARNLGFEMNDGGKPNDNMKDFGNGVMRTDYSLGGIPTVKYDYENKNINWQNFDLKYPDGRVFANVKLYKNGNRHIKFDKEFLKRLNVEAGRLFGWLKEPKDAETEIGVSAKEAAELWKMETHIPLENAVGKLGLTYTADGE